MQKTCATKAGSRTALRPIRILPRLAPPTKPSFRSPSKLSKEQPATCAVFRWCRPKVQRRFHWIVPPTNMPAPAPLDDWMTRKVQGDRVYFRSKSIWASLPASPAEALPVGAGGWETNRAPAPQKEGSGTCPTAITRYRFAISSKPSGTLPKANDTSRSKSDELRTWPATVITYRKPRSS